MKKGFTLFEILIVIILISILYLFAINSFTHKSSTSKIANILNMKTNLLKSKFQNKIEIKCFDDFNCYVYVDDKIQEEKFVQLFSDTPNVYEYDKNLLRIEFESNVIFKYKCTNDNKCSEMIVEYNDKMYILNNILQKVKIVKDIEEVDNHFNNPIQEIKDAF